MFCKLLLVCALNFIWNVKLTETQIISVCVNSFSVHTNSIQALIQVEGTLIELVRGLLELKRSHIK